MLDPRIRRAQHLLRVSRPGDAEQELRHWLSEQPEDALGHALLAYALSEQKRHDEARREAMLALQAAPDIDYYHYTLALISLDAGRYREARGAIDEALRLDPENPDSHAVSSRIHLAKSKPREALAAAVRGLEYDPEHETCNNLRAIALNTLGETGVAGETLDANLARNPENSLTHAVKGWQLLRTGDPRGAERHFTESLRLAPENESAREGLLASLRSRSAVYRGLQRFFFAMATLSPQMRIGVSVGAIVLYKLVVNVLLASPALRPFAPWVMAAYLILVMATWIGPSLFNALVFFHPLGRLALTRRERWSSVSLLLILCLCVGCIVAWNRLGYSPGLIMAVTWFVSMLPVAVFFLLKQVWSRVLVGTYLGLYIVFAAFTSLALHQGWSGALAFTGLMSFSVLVFSFVAGPILSRDARP